MPLVRIDLVEGKSEQYRAQVGDIVYQTLVDVLSVPEHDRFQVITEHTKASQPFDRDYLGIHRSDACIFFQITLNSGRSTELKQRFYKTLADRLHEGVKIPKEDVFINFVEVPKENWSFGNGEAQYVTPPKQIKDECKGRGKRQEEEFDTHMVETNHLLCSKAVAVPAPKVEVNDTDSKDKLVAALKEFFDFCSDALAKMDDSKLAETTGRIRRKASYARLVEPGPGRHLGRPLRRNCNVSSLERPVAADCQEVRYEASVTERVQDCWTSDMKILAVIGQKGGNAKTTTALGVGVAATAARHTVVLIDLDPQHRCYPSRDISQQEKRK